MNEQHVNFIPEIHLTDVMKFDIYVFRSVVNVLFLHSFLPKFSIIAGNSLLKIDGLGLSTLHCYHTVPHSFTTFTYWS